MSPESRYPIILSNTETVPGKQIAEFYGLVTGNTVRGRLTDYGLIAK